LSFSAEGFKFFSVQQKWIHRKNMKMLLVDDHALFRAGLRSLLQSRYPDAELVEAGDGAAAISRAEELKPDLVILDLHLPDQDGLDVCTRIRAGLPSVKIIILSGDLNLTYLDRALETGAVGYLLKLSTPEELPLAVDAVLSGKLYLCQDVNGEVL
jgi:DNA-binding NarL/FixJ family response regulator